MVSLEECKKILGAAGKDLSDDQIRMIREKLYTLATIALDTEKIIRDEGVER